MALECEFRFNIPPTLYTGIAAIKVFLAVLIFSVAAAYAKPYAVIETNAGTVEIELRADVAPKACDNFVKLAKKGYYNGLIFHRVIKNFMIQGGDPTGTGRGGESAYGRPFEDEFSPKLTFDKPYVLAMANRGPNTNTSQFFITTAPTQWLNGMHTVFGVVVKGQDIVKKIESTPTAAMDRPVSEQKIIKITIKE